MSYYRRISPAIFNNLYQILRMKITHFVAVVLLFVVLFNPISNAQESIDGTIAFQSDPAKKYAVYVPSSYDPNEASPLMLGFHPFNPSRWDAISWRDTLINFVEENGLLLICPDGGADGKVDDAIDTAFTSLLIDSMEQWYNVDLEQKYIIGFSWGGRTAYTYGMKRPEEFAGYIPIGAAIDGTQQVNSILPNANNEKFYIIHGSNDALSTRYTPIFNALQTNDACVESNVMPGVGHTIDFPNRNQILSEAYQWVSNPDNCVLEDVQEVGESPLIKIYPNPIKNEQDLVVDLAEPNNIQEIEFYTPKGELVIQFDPTQKSIPMEDMEKGTYIIRLVLKTNEVIVEKLVIE